VRIIAGAYKGRRLVTPRGDVTRPTADQVRIALMDTLMPWLPAVRLLDLFAGAGGVGLEALSRGAAHVTFVERDARAVTALRDNVATLGVADAAHVVRDDVLRALAALRRAKVRDALAAYTDEEAAKLVDDAEVARAAVRAAEEDGVVFIDEIDKVAGPASRAGGLSASASGAAPNERRTCSGSGDPYVVVRCRGTRPAERISASIASGGSSWPHSEPAAREIDSFISVPPRSLTPAASACLTPSGPSFTQLACTFWIRGCRASRATASGPCFWPPKRLRPSPPPTKRLYDRSYSKPISHGCAPDASRGSGSRAMGSSS